MSRAILLKSFVILKPAFFAGRRTHVPRKSSQAQSRIPFVTEAKDPAMWPSLAVFSKSLRCPPPQVPISGATKSDIPLLSIADCCASSPAVLRSRHSSVEFVHKKETSHVPPGPFDEVSDLDPAVFHSIEHVLCPRLGSHRVPWSHLQRRPESPRNHSIPIPSESRKDPAKLSELAPSPT